MKKKKTIKIVLISILAVVLAVVAVFAIFGEAIIATIGANRWSNQLEAVQNTPDADVLNYFATKSDFTYDMNDFKRQLKNANSVYSSEQSKGEDILASAQDIPEEYKAFFQDANNSIISYFEENFDVSVKEQLDGFEMKQADLQGIGKGAFAYDSDTGEGNTIYFEKKELESPLSEKTEYGKSSLLGVYIHETVHYLGFRDVKIDNADAIIEGFTQVMTIEIMKYMKLDVSSEERTYEANARLARQLMMANKDIVKNVVLNNDRNGAAVLFDELSKVLGKERTTDLFTLHHIINCYFLAPQFMTKGDVLNVAQYLTAEYCKNFELTDEQILEIHSNFVAPVSAI